MAIAKTLPGFKEIEFGCARRLFVNYREPVREGGIVEADGDFTGIPVSGLIDCSVSCEDVSGETVYTTLLKFRIKDCGAGTRRLVHELTATGCCFRLTDVYGEKYLLGLIARPHPAVKSTFQSGETPAGQRLFTVEIRYVNTHSILQLR